MRQAIDEGLGIRRSFGSATDQFRNCGARTRAHPPEHVRRSLADGRRTLQQFDQFRRGRTLHGPGEEQRVHGGEPQTFVIVFDRGDEQWSDLRRISARLAHGRERRGAHRGVVLFRQKLEQSWCGRCGARADFTQGARRSFSLAGLRGSECFRERLNGCRSDRGKSFHEFTSDLGIFMAEVLPQSRNARRGGGAHSA
jgi:hypothetical protein